MQRKYLTQGLGQNKCSVNICYCYSVCEASQGKASGLCDNHCWFTNPVYLPKVFPGGSSGKESACQCRKHGFDPWVGQIPWRRKWLPTLVFLPREFHVQRCLVGYSPWTHKKPDMTERLGTHLSSQYASLRLEKEWPYDTIWLRVLSHVQLLSDLVDCSLTGFSVHGILQARVLRWVAISFSRDLPDPGIEPMSLAFPALTCRFFTTGTT